MDRPRRFGLTAVCRQRVRRVGRLAPLAGALLQYLSKYQPRAPLRLAHLLVLAPHYLSIACKHLSRHRRVWRIWYVYLAQPRSPRGLVKRLMEQTSRHPVDARPAQSDTTPDVSPNGTHPQPDQQGSQPKAPPKPPRLILLVRHGQTTYNLEGRLPGQLPGVALTDEGRRQAQRAAVALAGLPLSAVIASPLERARETAEIIARGWALPVNVDERLMDTDVAFWSGQKIEDINRTDPRWKAFVENPTAPPEGVESLASVQQRSVAVVEDVLREPSLGNHIVMVAHADIVKLIIGHYSRMSVDSIRYVAIGNASISVLAFGEEAAPHLLAVNWTALPFWLFPPSRPAQAEPPHVEPQQVPTPAQRPAGSDEAMIQAPGGVEMSERSLQAGAGAKEQTGSHRGDASTA